MALDDSVEIISYFGLLCCKVVFRNGYNICLEISHVVQGWVESLVSLVCTDSVCVSEEYSQGVVGFGFCNVANEFAIIWVGRELKLGGQLLWGVCGGECWGLLWCVNGFGL